MSTHTVNHPKIKRPRPDSRPLQFVAGRGFLAVVVASLLIGACIVCARWGIADRIASDATMRQMGLQAHAARTGEALSSRDAGALVESFLLAQHLDPANPGLAEQLGGVYALDVREEGADNTIHRQWQKSLAQYSKAVVMRPTSPYSWANRAWTKYYLGEVDDHFYQALVNAIRLGPWEPEVQFVVADLGFALWDKMPVELRPEVLALAQNAQNRYPGQIALIAKKRGRLAEVCHFEKLASTPICKTPAQGG